MSVVEAKGCLDGQNTTIFIRSPNADEFIIWSLCQNPGSDPGHNAWSGIHTRLGPEIIAMHKQVDGLVVWDMLCGTEKRPCPKIVRNEQRLTRLAEGSKVPPPCIFLFPRTIPDYRNNPFPRAWALNEVRLLEVLHRVFKGERGEITEVRFEAGHDGTNVLRTTHLSRGGHEIVRSHPDVIRRARG